jgi:hypothetical protein
VRPIPRVIAVAGVAVSCAAAFALFVMSSRPEAVSLAFWFERISEDARTTLPERLTGGISPDEMKLIETISREEIVAAFTEYPVSVVGREAGLYHVRVVDSMQSSMGGSAESYVLPGLGGQGYINFRSLAHGAVEYAPSDAERHDIISAVGRGIGRAAVHEFTHQILGRDAPIHASTDVQSYEYGSALRREQYYGAMRWDIAAPMLRRKLGSTVRLKPDTTYYGR